MNLLINFRNSFNQNVRYEINQPIFLQFINYMRIMLKTAQMALLKYANISHSALYILMCLQNQFYQYLVKVNHFLNQILQILQSNFLYLIKISQSAKQVIEFCKNNQIVIKKIYIFAIYKRNSLKNQTKQINMQPQYGQPVYVQQQPYPGTYQYQQGSYYQQPGMGQPIMVQPGYGQQQVLVETVMIAQEIPQGFPTVQMGMQQQRYLPNNANGCEYTTRIQCPACQKEIHTIVESKSGGAVYAWVAITCFCCFPFCFIPCFIDSCKDKIHTCPFCQTEVGICQKSMC
ncbi:hypothetical protein ABPG72_021536 [Tetrahymena utriculariae]